MKKACALYSMLLLALLMASPSWLPDTHVQYESFAQGTPTIYLQPIENMFYTNQTVVGDCFNVTVWVRDAPQIVGWQVRMEFNDSAINVTQWIEPTNDPQYILYGKTAFANPTPPDPGYVHLGTGRGRAKMESLLFPTTQPPSSGSGKLCVLEFNITRYPTGDTISSLLNITSIDTLLLSPDGGEVSPVNKQDGSFNYVFITVPPLRLVGSPQSIQFTPYQDVIGGSFNTTVSVDGPVSEVGLTNVSFTLNYDSSLFYANKSHVFLNSNVWIGPHSILIDTGQVTITVSNSSPLPLESSVIICTIAFTIQEQQSVPPQTLGDHIDTGINFTSSTMLNSAGDTIDQTPPYNQTIRIYAYQTEVAVLEITRPAITSTSASTQNLTWFNVNVSVTDVYDPSFIQVELLYNKSAITCIEVNPIGEVAYDLKWNYSISQPGLVIANVSISGHTNPLLSGPIFQLKFKTVTENATSYLNFSRPYGEGTFIRDSLGAVVNATYVETAFPVGETPDASSSITNPPWEWIMLATGIVAGTTIAFIILRRRKKTKQIWV